MSRKELPLEPEPMSTARNMSLTNDLRRRRRVCRAEAAWLCTLVGFLPPFQCASSRLSHTCAHQGGNLYSF